MTVSTPDESHPCPGPCGGRPVSKGKLTCASCWRLVPKPLQKRLYRTWNRGKGEGTSAHWEAVAAVLRFFKGEDADG